MNIPVVYHNPFTGDFELMPVAMVNAYVPFASQLKLEEAAKLAHMRDVDASINLLLSIKDVDPLLSRATEYPSEGCKHDPLSVEPPSLR